MVYTVNPINALAQGEKAYQKQDAVFVGAKNLQTKHKGKMQRWYKSVGLGFKTPRTAIDGTYIDKKCPFTGNVAIRGRILRAVVMSTKMKRSIVVRRDYLHYIRKYQRYEKRHSNISAHLTPAFKVKEGDLVTVGECRPLSKTIRFNVIKVNETTDANGKKQFNPY